MPKTLRQPRHSCLASRSRVRALLLCSMAVSCAGCPAVVDLDDPEQDPPDASIIDNFIQADAATPREPSNDAAGDSADPLQGASEPPDQGVTPPPPTLDQNTRCPPPPPSEALEDAGAPDPGPGPGARAASPLTSPPDRLVALRAVLAAGYSLPCGAEQTHVLPVPDGYELSALGRSRLCSPFETLLYRLRVSKSGQISILSAVPASPAQLQCDAGAPELAPELLTPPLA